MLTAIKTGVELGISFENQMYISWLLHRRLEGKDAANLPWLHDGRYFGYLLPLTHDQLMNYFQPSG